MVLVEPGVGSDDLFLGGLPGKAGRCKHASCPLPVSPAVTVPRRPRFVTLPPDPPSQCSHALMGRPPWNTHFRGGDTSKQNIVCSKGNEIQCENTVITAEATKQALINTGTDGV